MNDLVEKCAHDGMMLHHQQHRLTKTDIFLLHRSMVAGVRREVLINGNLHSDDQETLPKTLVILLGDDPLIRFIFSDIQ